MQIDDIKGGLSYAELREVAEHFVREYPGNDAVRKVTDAIKKRVEVKEALDVIRGYNIRSVADAESWIKNLSWGIKHRERTRKDLVETRERIREEFGSYPDYQIEQINHECDDARRQIKILRDYIHLNKFRNAD